MTTMRFVSTLLYRRIVQDTNCLPRCNLQLKPAISKCGERTHRNMQLFTRYSSSSTRMSTTLFCRQYHLSNASASGVPFQEEEEVRRTSAKNETTRKILLDHGCGELEFFECPEVLKVSPTEVKSRLRRLKLLKVEFDITPVMVNLAAEKKTVTLKKQVKKYHATHGGQSSRVRQLRSRLNLSDADLQLLVDSGAKLLHSTAKIKSVDCLEWLLWKGYTLEEITEVPEVLDKSVEVMSGRHKDISAFGLERPLLIYLSLTHKQYHALMVRFKVNPNAAETIKMAGGMIHARSVAVANVKQMEPLWQFLATEGFENEEIKRHSSELLKVDFERLKRVVKSCKTILSPDGDTFELHTLILLCSNTVKSRKAALQGILNCSIKDLPSSQRGSPFALLYAQEPDIYFQNLKFLFDCGFTREDISNCPVIIGHRPHIVAQCWDIVTTHDSQVVKDIKENQMKYLEMLQYEIEKESNFMHGILI